MTGLTATNQRVDILGVHVNAGNVSSSVQTIRGWVTRREKHYVCITGVHGVIESQNDPELIEIHNGSGLTTTDGMPLVWCARRAGFTDAERVYGPDLMLAVCEEGARFGWRMYYYGAAPGVASTLAAEMPLRFPGLETAGHMSPPFGELSTEEQAAINQEINDTRPDIIWVGLSTPKQERWIARNRTDLVAPVLIGVGAAFDFHTGAVAQAPSWMQRSGLEWLFRLSVEPKRLWRRYFRIVPSFLWKILREPPRVVYNE